MTLKNLSLAIGALALVACGDTNKPAAPSSSGSVSVPAVETPAATLKPELGNYDWSAIGQLSAWTSKGSDTAASLDGTNMIVRDGDLSGYDNVRRFLSVDGDGATVVEATVDASLLEGNFAMIRFTLTDAERSQIELGFAPGRDAWHFNSTVMSPTLSCEMESATIERANVRCESDVPFAGVMIDVFPAFGAPEKGYGTDATGTVEISNLDVVLR